MKSKFLIFISFLILQTIQVSADTDVISGHALNYTASNQYATASGIPLSLPNFTIEAWIYHHTISDEVERYVTIGSETIVLRHDGTIYGGPDELHFYIKDINNDDHSIRVDNVLETGVWMHIAGTYDGNEMKLYLNGELIGTHSTNVGVHQTDGNITLSKSNQMTNAKIDEVRLWNVARSAEEIREHIHIGLWGNEAGFENYWQFNEGTGTTVEDKVGSSDLTIHNITNDNWVESTIPFGSGNADALTISQLITYTLPGAEMEIKSLSGNMDFAVSRIENGPNVYPDDVGTVHDYHERYLVISNYSDETYNADATFLLKEDLDPYGYYEYCHGSVRFYHRPENSDGDWTYLRSANSINFWDYDEDGAEYNDFALTGQFLAFLIYPDTISGNMLNFDGQDEFVQCENTSEYAYHTHSFTAEAWIKPDAMSQGQHSIIKKGSQWQLSLYDDGDGLSVFEFGVNDNNVFSAYPVITAEITGKWVHVAGVKNNDGSTVTVYVNGQAGTADAFDVIPGDAANLKISENFKGEIDEIMLWRIAKTESEIRNKMYRTANEDDRDILSIYQFNETSGETIWDLGYGNNGTLTNMESEDRVSSTAPVPFQTNADGNWNSTATWQTGQGTPTYDWSRVYINNDVTLNENQTLIDLTVFESASLDIDASKNLTVTGELSVKNENGGLVLKSDENSTASLIIEGTSSVDITVERYLSADKWHYISAQTHMVGNFSTLEMGLTGGIGNDQFYRWEEDYQYGGNTGIWVDILNGEDGTGANTLLDDEGFVPAKGYTITYKDNPKTLSLSGTPHLENQSITLHQTPASSNPGSNLVGNPFCSTIAVNEAAEDNVNFLEQNAPVLDDAYEAVYIWNEDAGWNGTTNADYDTYNNASAAFYIQPGQAFMVQAASDDAELHFNTNIRKHGSATFYKKTEDNEFARVRLGVTNPENLSNYSDFFFRDGMSKALDPSYDAVKYKGNQDLALYSKMLSDNSLDLAIQALPFFDEDYEIAIGLDAEVIGNYTFSLISAKNLPDDINIYLEDLDQGFISDMKKDSTCVCYIGTAGISTNRFKLHFIRENSGIGDQQNYFPMELISLQDVLQIKNPNGISGKVTVYSTMGGVITRSPLNGNPIQNIHLNCSAGYYLVKLELKDQVFVKKILVN